MKQTLWLVVATALVFGGLMSVVDLGARQTVPQQVHESDRLLIATDLDQLQRDAKAVADSLAENKEGKVYTAAVPGTDPDHLALAVALVDGRIFGVGDIDVRFPLMSVSKPFTYALALEQHGVDFMIDRIGVSATGFPYNAVAAGAVRRTSEQNPLVNAGAIATHGYIEGATPADKISAVIEFYSRMANRSLSIEETWRVAPRALTYTRAFGGGCRRNCRPLPGIEYRCSDGRRPGYDGRNAGGRRHSATDWRTYPEIRDRAHGPVGYGHCGHV
jgi:hypothetical protein